MISTADLQKFIQPHSDPGVEGKYVWKLEKQEVKYVPLKQTTLFERVQAWFGYGPLSLVNIAEFIGACAQDIRAQTDLTREEKNAVLGKFQKCCYSYNTNHWIRKVSGVAISTLSPPDALFYRRDATYETDGAGIDDVVYANGSLGFGYVVDGAGHNNKIMAEVLNDIFNKFNSEYEGALQNTRFNSIEDYTAFVFEQLNKLANTIDAEKRPIFNPESNKLLMNSDSYKPAFSFVQIAKLGDTRFVISAQYADTALLIRKANGSFDSGLAYRRDPLGLGSPSIKLENIIQVSDVAVGDIIYGYSDGIGEFLRMEKMQEIISNTDDPTTLLGKLKEEIIRSGREYKKPEGSIDSVMNNIKAASGRNYIKFHNLNDADCYDDISIFSLPVI